jgi:hypothetical protein
MATTWLAFLVFLLPRKDMPGRLSAVSALFLALAAIQFVITDHTPASSYVTALQQLVLMSYCCLILVSRPALHLAESGHCGGLTQRSHLRALSPALTLLPTLPPGGPRGRRIVVVDRLPRGESQARGSRVGRVAECMLCRIARTLGGRSSPCLRCA